MAVPIEFFFDVGSPYSYLAHDRIAGLAGEIPVLWRPILLGGVFKATGNSMPAAVTARVPYLLQDLQRCARRQGTPFRFSSHFPPNTLLAMRAITGMSGEGRRRTVDGLFRAAWVEDRDLSDPGVLLEILGGQALERAQVPEVKDELRATTDEAVRRGAFGAPTCFVGEQMFFGNDRLEHAMEAALALG